MRIFTISLAKKYQLWPYSGVRRWIKSQGITKEVKLILWATWKQAKNNPAVAERFHFGLQTLPHTHTRKRTSVIMSTHYREMAWALYLCTMQLLWDASLPRCLSCFVWIYLILIICSSRAINQGLCCALILRLLHIAALFIHLLVGLTYICMLRGNFNFLYFSCTGVWSVASGEHRCGLFGVTNEGQV